MGFVDGELVISIFFFLFIDVKGLCDFAILIVKMSGVYILLGIILGILLKLYSCVSLDGYVLFV